MRRIGSPRSPRPTWWTQYLAERFAPATPTPNASADPAAANAFAAGVLASRLDEATTPRRPQVTRGVSRSPDAVEGFDAAGVLVFAAERHTDGAYRMTFPTRSRIRSAIETTRTAACYGAVHVVTRTRVR